MLSHKIPKGSSRLKIALGEKLHTANAVGNLKDSDLGKFFKKVAFRKGRQAAISATARWMNCWSLFGTWSEKSNNIDPKVSISSLTKKDGNSL